MDIDVGQVITIITVIGGFAGQTLYFRGVFTTRLDDHEREIDTLRETVQYKDNCDDRHGGHETRIGLLEKIRNGIK